MTNNQAAEGLKAVATSTTGRLPMELSVPLIHFKKNNKAKDLKANFAMRSVLWNQATVEATT